MPRPIRVLPAVLLVGLSVSSTYADEPLQEGAAFAAVDACVQQEMRDQRTPGASLAIAMGGRQVYTQTYGVKRSGTSETIGPNTYFRIQSTTKMMTSAAILREVERGTLDLHAPLTEYLPELTLREPWSADDFTLHRLLSSSSMLPATYAYEGIPAGGRPSVTLSLQEWVTTLKLRHLYAPPGSFFNYSSSGFSVAAAALESVTGLEYGNAVQRSLWEPAGMLRTTMDPAVVMADGDYSHGHLNGEHTRPDDYAEFWARPAAGAFSTPSEMLVWAAMLSDGGRDVLTSGSVTAMTSPQVPVTNVPITSFADYGYGVFVEDFQRLDDPDARVTVLYHPGNGRGYSSELFWVPEMGFAVSILANTVSGLDRSALCALREVAGLTRVRHVAPPPDDAQLDRHTGTYAMVDSWGLTWTARVWHEGGGLRVRYTDWSTLPTIASIVPEADMRHRHGSTFSYQAYGSGDAQFLDAADGGAHSHWMEHLNIVGQRAGDLPDEIEIEGGTCTSVQFTPDHDLPGSALRASGTNPVHRFQSTTITQDDPDRPERAKIKLDLPAEGEVAFLMAYQWAEEDDDIDLYLLRDVDGDGAFSWPEERVDDAIGSRSAILARTPLPAGRYQLWVHGRQVRGAESMFNLDVVMVAGNDLELKHVPDVLKGGREQTFELCANPLADGEPRLGMVTLEMGDGKRVARVPVRVKPGGMMTERTIYLPRLQ